MTFYCIFVEDFIVWQGTLQSSGFKINTEEIIMRKAKCMCLLSSLMLGITKIPICWKETLKKASYGFVNLRVEQ